LYAPEVDGNYRSKGDMSEFDAFRS